MHDDEFEDHLRKIELAGYTVLPNVLSDEECVTGRKEIDRILKEESALECVSQHPTSAQIYNLMNKAEVFERLYGIQGVLRVIRYFLGEDAVVSSMQAHVVFPGAGTQKLHFDGRLTGPYSSEPEGDRGRRITSHVLGFNVVFCFSEFKVGHGATRVVPGSHRMESYDLVEDASVPGELIVEAPQGSVLIFNLATWHGASEHTGDSPRYAVMNPWRRSWIRPEADMSRLVTKEVMESAGSDARTIFGFRARSPYTDRWQWDMKEGRPKSDWKELERDEPLA